MTIDEAHHAPPTALPSPPPAPLDAASAALKLDLPNLDHLDLPDPVYASEADTPEVVPNRADRRAAGERASDVEGRPNHLLRLGVLGLVIGGIAVTQFAGIPLAIAAAGAAGGATVGAGAYGAHRLRQRYGGGTGSASRSGGMASRALRAARSARGRSGGLLSGRSGAGGSGGNRSGGRSGSRSGFGRRSGAAGLLGGLGRSGRAASSRSGRSGLLAGHRSAGVGGGRGRSGLATTGHRSGGLTRGTGAGSRSGSGGGRSTAWPRSGAPTKPQPGSWAWRRQQRGKAKEKARLEYKRQMWREKNKLRAARRQMWMARRSRMWRAAGRGIWVASKFFGKYAIGVPVTFAAVGTGRTAYKAWQQIHAAYAARPLRHWPRWFRTLATRAGVASMAARLLGLVRSLWQSLTRLPVWWWSKPTSPPNADDTSKPTALPPPRTEHPHQPPPQQRAGEPAPEPPLRAEAWVNRPAPPPQPTLPPSVLLPIGAPAPAPAAVPAPRQPIPLPPAPERLPAPTIALPMRGAKPMHPACEKVIEAFREAIGGYELPDNNAYHELDSFFASWSEMFVEMGNIQNALAEKFKSDTPVDNAVAEYMEDVASGFGVMAQEWPAVYQAWAAYHEHDRIRAEGERGPNEAAFNVT